MNYDIPIRKVCLLWSLHQGRVRIQDVKYWNYGLDYNYQTMYFYSLQQYPFHSIGLRKAERPLIFIPTIHIGKEL